MKEIKTSMGVLKYRYPTILETLAMTRVIKSSVVASDMFESKAKILENLQPMLDYSSMDSGITCFEDLNVYGEEMTPVLFDIAEDILAKVLSVYSKKS